ncbi:conserved hypothetical protein [Ricinus communis]|uniref:Uncharacterized protein n=1 Tax=Ricinus communis TaxID=3988 RepID=B9S0P5_RICCO|nr:conserved hypothetical protein [Ricinus communis]
MPTVKVEQAQAGFSYNELVEEGEAPAMIYKDFTSMFTTARVEMGVHPLLSIRWLAPIKAASTIRGGKSQDPLLRPLLLRLSHPCLLLR